MADGKVEIETKIDSKNLEKDSKTVLGKLKKIGKQAESAGKSIATLGGIGSAVGGFCAGVDAIAKSIGKIKQSIEECIVAYDSQITAEKALEVACRNNPYLNNESVKALKNFANEAMKITTIADEELMASMAQLAGAGRTQTEIQEIMKVAMDISASGAMSLDSAVKNLNKTYSGLAGELGESIPQIRNLTKEQLQNGEAVKVLGKQYEGLAEEVANATSSTPKLSNAFKSFMEEIGSKLSNFFAPFQEGLANLFNGISEKLRGSRQELERVLELERLTKKMKDNTASASELEELASLSEKYKNDCKDIEKLEKKRIKTLKQEQFEYENLLIEIESIKKEKEEILSNTGLSTNPEDFKKWEKQYDDLIAKRQAEAEKKSVTVLALTADSDSIKKLADEKKLQETKEETVQAEIQAQKSANEIASEAIANYKEKIALAQKEIDLKRELGEEITKEAELSTMLATKQRAGLEMLNEAQGTITTNNPFFKQIQEDINADAKELEALIATQKDYEELTKHFADVIKEETAPAWREYYDVLDSLQNQFDNIKDRLPIDKVEELSAKLAKARKQIHDSLAVPDVDESIQAKYDEQIKLAKEMRDETERLTQEIARIEEEARLASLNGEQMLADQKLAIIEDYNMRKAELIQQATQIEKQAYQEQQTAIYASYQNKVETVTGYTRQICDIVTQASNFMLQIAQNQATAEQAQIEAKYRKGEMSEEEYNEAITNAKRKAAREQYKIQMVQWIASCLQATANIAEGVTKCLASGPAGIPQAVLVGASGAIALASVVASKPIPPNFTTGGIVGGSSYHGDNIATNLNSKEMVMNQAQQKGLWDFINGGSQSNGGGVNIQINNTASNMVEAEPKIDQNKITLLIKAKVKEGLKNGDFDSELNTAQQGMGGDYLGI